MEDRVDQVDGRRQDFAKRGARRREGGGSGRDRRNPAPETVPGNVHLEDEDPAAGDEDPPHLPQGPETVRACSGCRRRSRRRRSSRPGRGAPWRRPGGGGCGRRGPGRRSFAGPGRASPGRSRSPSRGYPDGGGRPRSPDRRCRSQRPGGGTCRRTASSGRRSGARRHRGGG